MFYLFSISKYSILVNPDMTQQVMRTMKKSHIEDSHI